MWGKQTPLVAGEGVVYRRWRCEGLAGGGREMRAPGHGWLHNGGARDDLAPLPDGYVLEMIGHSCSGRARSTEDKHALPNSNACFRSHIVKYKPDGWLGFIMGAALYINFDGKYPFQEAMTMLQKELDGRGRQSIQADSSGAGEFIAEVVVENISYIQIFFHPYGMMTISRNC